MEDNSALDGQLQSSLRQLPLLLRSNDSLLAPTCKKKLARQTESSSARVEALNTTTTTKR